MTIKVVSKNTFSFERDGYCVASLSVEADGAVAFEVYRKHSGDELCEILQEALDVLSNVDGNAVEVHICGWDGLIEGAKIAAIKAVRAHAPLPCSLVEAKQAVESATEEAPEVLRFVSMRQAERVANNLSNSGVLCRVV